MSEAQGRAWRFYADDMAGFCERVLAYTQGLNRETFSLDRLRYDATVRNLELIGEAATHIPEAVRHAEPTIPWRQVIATRNRLIHAYLGIDDDIVWSIVTDDIPDLLVQLNLLRSRP